ncbi:E3 SUMO-protein ligase ZBED1-like [Zophobas morio]|uniref:E3 SUMO-protein ligase ZBED1-like n=1 Tax=Zophobas morio TaxID=2755281 RepID=UPI0030830050
MHFFLEKSLLCTPGLDNQRPWLVKASGKLTVSTNTHSHSCSTLHHCKMSKNNKRSEIWNFFTQVDQQIAKCDICKQHLSFKSSISNLKKHVERKHPAIQISRKFTGSQEIEGSNINQTPVEILLIIAPGTSAKPKSAQENITSFFAPKKLNSSAQKKINDSLIKLFTKDYQPFSIVEDQGFRGFVECLNPTYKLPDRRTISKSLVPAAYEKCRQDMEEGILMIQNVSLTTDCWTSSNNDAFLAVTAHFINANFKLKSLLLECIQMNESHTSQNLSTELEKIIIKWKMQGKVALVISDNANNITHAIRDILQLKHFGCFAHSINLVVQNSLKLVDTVIIKVRNVVSYFKRSIIGKEKLMNFQKNNNMDPKKVIQDVSTRWNSTFYMLERFIELKDALRGTIALMDKATVPILNSEEWQICAELCDVLRPFENVTKIVSGENYPTASLVIPLVRGFYDVIENQFNSTYLPAVQTVIREVKNQIDQRFGSIESSKTLGICTFLDPRFKHMGFRDKNNAANVKKNLLNELAEEIKNKEKLNPNINLTSASTSAVNAPEKFSIWNSFDKSLAELRPQGGSGSSGTAMSRAIIEIDNYINESFLPRTEDPLLWWKTNSHNFPNLTKIMKNKLCCVATSVPCERVFSKTGMLLTDRRNRLGHQSVSRLVFLNVNS